MSVSAPNITPGGVLFARVVSRLYNAIQARFAALPRALPPQQEKRLRTPHFHAWYPQPTPSHGAFLANGLKAVGAVLSHPGLCPDPLTLQRTNMFDLRTNTFVHSQNLSKSVQTNTFVQTRFVPFLREQRQPPTFCNVSNRSFRVNGN